MKSYRKLLIVLLLILIGCGEQPDKSARILVLKGATLLDGNGNRVENGTLVIRDSVIEAVGDSELDTPEGAEIIDMSGKYICPGLVDAHVHFAQTGFVDGRPDAMDIRDSINYSELQARLQSHPEPFYEAYLRSGVTAVYDVGGPPWTIAMQKSAENDPLAPHVAAAGPLLTPVPQEDLETFNTPDQKQMIELSSPEIGKEVVRKNTALGSTGIKIWQINLQDPAFMEGLEAVAEEAKAVGNHLIAHATTLDQAKKAIGLGAKVLVHSVEDKQVDVDFLAAAKTQNITYIPTLVVLGGYYKIYKGLLDGGIQLDDPNQVVDPHTRALVEGAKGFAHLVDTAMLRSRLPRMEQYIAYSDSIMALNLYRVYRSGIRIAAGTDAGNPGTLPGISFIDELEAMQQAGIPAADVLVMATRNGAVAMNRSGDLGTLEAGKQADLVVLEKDPTSNISNLRTLTDVMRGGILHPVGEKLQTGIQE